MPRAHDLLRIDRPERVAVDAPAWVRSALATGWVVTRRARSAAGLVAVGVRGRDRAARFALWLAPERIAEAVSPERLSARPAPRREPAFRALDQARSELDAVGLPWGPTGSVGFELATGAPTVSPDSDLDLLVRARGRVPLADLVALHRALQGLDAPVDCQVELGAGAVSLAELVSGARRLLLRTPTGPCLLERRYAL